MQNCGTKSSVCSNNCISGVPLPPISTVLPALTATPPLSAPVRSPSPVGAQDNSSSYRLHPHRHLRPRANNCCYPCRDYVDAMPLHDVPDAPSVYAAAIRVCCPVLASSADVAAILGAELSEERRTVDRPYALFAAGVNFDAIYKSDCCPRTWEKSGIVDDNLKSPHLLNLPAMPAQILTLENRVKPSRRHHHHLFLDCDRGASSPRGG